jgi:hypothetical protein
MQRGIALTGLALLVSSCGTPLAAPVGLPAPVQAQATQARNSDMPGLLHHVLFFDENGDRQITLSESRHGLERLGIGTLQSTALSLVLNPILGKQAGGGLTTTVSVDGLVRNFKPSTTGIFGAGGRFNAPRFESLFTKNDLNKDGALDSDEIDIMLKLDLADPSLEKRTKVGFDLLLKVAGDRQVTDEDGRELTGISKNRLKSFYDGNLFHDIAARNRR